MRTTSNPVIRNLLVATSHAPEQRETRASKRLSHLRQASPTERPLSTDDVVVKTALSLGIVAVSAFLTAIFDLGALAIPALLAALGLTIYSVVRPRPSRTVTVAYATTEGVLVGAVIDVMESVFPGVAVQAAVGTVGVFAGLLVGYRTRKLRISPKFTRWVIGVIVGTLVLTLVNVVARALGTDLGLTDGGIVSIIVAVALIALASLSLLLDLDAADRMLQMGVAAKWSWYLAFGLVGTLVWLYVDIIWLISYFR